MHLGYYFGCSLQAEVLILAVIGILNNIFDISFLWVGSQIDRIWLTEMDPSKFSDMAQLFMRILSTATMLIQCYSVPIYLCCYIVMLYPIIYEYRPRMLVPWLVVNAIRCLLTGLITLFTSIYACVIYCFEPPVCWEFFVLHLANNTPSIYIFVQVFSYYRELNKLRQVHGCIDVADSHANRLFSETDLTAPERRDSSHRSAKNSTTSIQTHENQRVSIGTSVNNPGSSIEIKCTEFRKMSSKDIPATKGGGGGNGKTDKKPGKDGKQVITFATPFKKPDDPSTMANPMNNAAAMINIDVYTSPLVTSRPVRPQDTIARPDEVKMASSSSVMRKKKLKSVKCRNRARMMMMQKRRQREERKVYKVGYASIQTQVSASVEKKSVCTQRDTEVMQLYKNRDYSPANSTIVCDDRQTQTRQKEHQSVVKFSLKEEQSEKAVVLDDEVFKRPRTP